MRLPDAGIPGVASPAGGFEATVPLLNQAAATRAPALPFVRSGSASPQSRPSTNRAAFAEQPAGGLESTLPMEGATRASATPFDKVRSDDGHATLATTVELAPEVTSTAATRGMVPPKTPGASASRGTPSSSDRKEQLFRKLPKRKT
jgi:hypothetical protein